MEKDILLINPPISRYDEPSSFPTGLGLIASILRNKGYPFNVLDINAYRFKKKDVLATLKKRYRIYCLTAHATQYFYIKWLSKKIKQINQDAIIILGGHLASFSYYVVLKNTEVDICCIGEGEETIYDLIKHIESKEQLYNVRGIIFKEQNRIIKTDDRPYISDLDTIPFPAYDLFPTRVYIEKRKFSMINKMNIVTSRGCFKNCAFCSHLFKGIRFRSVKNIIEEIIYLKENYNIKNIIFYDESFIANKKYTISFCEEIKKRQLGINWIAYASSDTIEESIAKEMREAGCRLIYLGIESGDQSILDEMRKKVTVNQIYNAVKVLRKYNIDIFPSFIVGSPEENDYTIQKTIKLCKDLNLKTSFRNIYYLAPLPGSEYYDRLIKSKKIRNEDKYMLSLNRSLYNKIYYSYHPKEQLIFWKYLIIYLTKKTVPFKEKLIKAILLYINKQNIHFGKLGIALYNRLKLIFIKT